MENKYSKIALFGDTYGVKQLLRYIPFENITCIVGAYVRSQYFTELEELSSSLKIPLLVQPKYKTKEYSEFLENFIEHKVDLILSNSYSMIVREDILQKVNYNCINIHFALLPKHRGPNPIQWAIIKGEKYSGVTIHYMDIGIDTGDIIAQIQIPIDSDYTWIDLKEKLIIVSDKILEEKLPEVLQGVNKRKKQDEGLSSTNFRLDSEYPKINFELMDDRKIYNLIRAQVDPLKGAYIQDDDEKKIYFNKKLSLQKIKKLRKEYAK